MDGLPGDVLLHILDFVNLKDRCSFAQVSEDCKDLVSSGSLWREVTLTITDDEVLLAVGKSPALPISDLRDYSEKYAACARSLTLRIKVDISNDNSLDSRLEGIVGALKTDKLEKFTLSFDRSLRAVDFQKMFLESKSPSQRARIICGLPSDGLLIMRKMCERLPLYLAKVSWMYKPFQASEPPGFISSLSLKFLGRSRPQNICRERSGDVGRNIFSCSQLGEFETNVYSHRLIVTLAESISDRGLNFILVFNEATMHNIHETRELTEEECRPLIMVLRVTWLKSGVVDKLGQLSSVLPIETLHLKATDAQSLRLVKRVLELTEQKFRPSLKKVVVELHGRKGNLQREVVKFIQKKYAKLIISDA